MSAAGEAGRARGLLWSGLLALSLGLASPAANGQQCTRDAICDDGVFCNGLERCSPQSPDSDTRGCVAGAPPCEAGLSVCVEHEFTCETEFFRVEQFLVDA